MDFADILFALFIVVVAVVSLLSNLLVLLCFVHSTEIRRQVPGVFTMNLSFCNILITVLNMPATLLGVVRNQKPFGDCVCHTVSFLETFLTANTMLSMAALSIDRWIAVVFPLSYATKMRYKDAVIMVGYSWLHSFTFSLTALLFSWVDYSDVYASCTLQPSGGGSDKVKFTVFTVVFHATSFALSLLILCFTYLKVLKVARFHCKRIDIITMQTLFLLVDIHPSVKQRCLAEQKRRKQRATKKISIFIGSFIICFAPYVITRLAELLPFVDVNRHWGIVSKCLTYSKAASDPFAYSLLRQQYKKVLVTVVNKLLRRDLYPSSGHNSSVDTENDYCLQRIS
ncbi:G-protein coupled receptor 26 isoform X1 [Xiphophorus maculatus]|uniref:G-protein coupled receptor 26 n=2 Tax=Xiphophorus maculatus TaxID=8083 RepID=A0A3B5Q6G9_XIPMA|nr:G-protein coupled receptor 26 isoform X1 [Xiphophorus maculatus]XP_023201543.1 G-protein coupled receptor 26 isoform X1 [Xiphophorus maculatus]XP_027894442.1 G-protein coupled receptor 26-like isoform X1 [Xiphophorus couchianus]XP_032439421.1 G-protein coupled receptor 26-like isoform X1 [Xiphophorus hellerii]